MTEAWCCRCAARRRTCCQGTRVFVTRGDVARIAAETGRDDFWENVPAGPANPQLATAFDPVWARIFRDGGRVRVLRHRNGGDCLFLTADGCALPLSARPLVCRLYPFDYTPGSIKGIHAPLCPEPESGNAPLLLALLAMNREEGEEQRKCLYREIAEEFPVAFCSTSSGCD